ncbi:MAG: helix-turn-helix domain-containing protein [Acidimicrobiales bacterium]
MSGDQAERTGGGGHDDGVRARNRRQRERAYLDAAMAIAVADGLDALTMARLAADVHAAVGSVYTYFPSKGALVAELQREAVERLTDSYHLVRDRSDVRLASWDDPRSVALARVAVFGAFWIASGETHPHEAALLHGLVSVAKVYVPPEERHRVLPASLALLGEAGAVVVGASDSGAIRPVTDPAGAVVRWAAALTGVLLTENLAQVPDYPVEPRALARELLHELLLGWGAEPARVERVEAHLRDLEADGPLAPRRPA